ncbi:MAG: ABC transporter permease [Desulfobacteraceae bacterium]|nr:ABC transporter permease [Desulfobacteraceae bacterium]
MHMIFNSAGRIGLILILFFTITGLLAPVLSPYNPNDYTGAPLQKPDKNHWLGTNDLGQDILSELIWGARISVFIGLAVGTFSMVIATGVALAAGVAGGRTDRILMRTADLFLAFPRLPSIIVIAAYLDSGIGNIIFVLLLFSWAKGARIIRSQVLSLMKQPHIEACVLFGATRRYIILRHILPEILPLSAFKFVKSSSYAMIAEAGLAFLSIGDPTAKSWGMMFHHIHSYPGIYCSDVWIWWFCPPAICLMLCILGFLFIGYSLEGIANPQIKTPQIT